MEMLKLLTLTPTVTFVDEYEEQVSQVVDTGVSEGAMLGALVIFGVLAIIILILCKEHLKLLMSFLGFAYIMISTIVAAVMSADEIGMVMGIVVFIQGIILGCILIGISRILNNTNSDSIAYIEQMLAYTKNQVIDIKEKLNDKEEEN